jgi:hypothetical protein
MDCRDVRITEASCTAAPATEPTYLRGNDGRAIIADAEHIWRAWLDYPHVAVRGT